MQAQSPIAQEVRKVIPEVVVGDEKKETLGVFYSDIIPVVIKGIQEQEATIEKLRAENAKLRKMHIDAFPTCSAHLIQPKNEKRARNRNTVRTLF